MKKVVGLIVVLGVIAGLFFWLNPTKSDTGNEVTPEFSQTQQGQVGESEDFFTNRNLNELDAVTYSNHKKMMEDLTGEGKLVRRATQQEFVGGKATGEGLAWIAYFEK